MNTRPRKLSQPRATTRVRPAARSTMTRVRLMTNIATAGNPLAVGAGLLLLLSGTTAAPAAVDFPRDVQPLISAKCYACHGPDEQSRKARLRLDLRDDALRDRGGSRAIHPGNPAASELFQRIVTANPDDRMPPPETGPALTREQVDLLERWIREGAPYASHWAFDPPQRPSLPAEAGSPLANPIDRFVFERLAQAGLTPSPPAERHALIRRVALDLVGLPPSPAEVDAFLDDPRPDTEAYAALVDRILASPHFGERWAQTWLDLARYADSAGYGSDPLRLNIWPYRDWVIDALNRNLPYDQFLLEQIAGDLLPEATEDQQVATAFHRNTMTNTEGGTDDEEWRVAAVKDRANVTGQAVMGLTFGCAQCHSHKFDPISHREYYQFFAFFNQTEDNDQPDEHPTLPRPTPEQRAARERFQAAIRQAEADPAAATPQLQAQVDGWRKELAAIKPAPLPVMRELPANKRRITRILNLGNFLDPGEPVEPGVPAAFHPLPPDAPTNRLGLAQWLVSHHNPLTARVAVNRLWAQLFGRGLVETEDDFGTQGTLPSHPELLDWLAIEFMEGVRPTPPAPAPLNPEATAPHAQPWNLKALLKLMVLSATYRQSATLTPHLQQRDPDNRLYARMSRRRLSAEEVRDQALALSGLLSRKIGGPSVYPPQPEGLWRAAFNGDRTWPTSTGENRYRRGLYTFWRRTVPYPSMATFDAPSRETCTFRRLPTNTPLQAYVTLNDPVHVECAQALARRLLREAGPTSADRIRYGLRLCLVRPPDPAHLATLLSLFAAELDHYRQRPDDALKLATEPIGPLPEGLDAAEAAAWTVIANVLLNLDGVLTKG